MAATKPKPNPRVMDLPAEWAGQEEEGPRLLMQERATSAVRPESMATYIYGGRRALARRLEALSFIESDPVFSTADRPYLNQVELYNRSSEKAVYLVKKCQALGLDYQAIASYFNSSLDEISPIDVHMKMVVPVLQHQTTPEQRAKWLPMAERFELTCAYAQTELGHGSNVQGLETTAKYDPKTETFVVHSPTLSSMKFWPGGLGKTSTHAVIMARLLLQGKDLGLHSFIVPIRSRVDHTPLPGVTLGDIGPKFGFNTVDNGFCIFNHVRIPRDHMLMGLVEVTREGQYRKKGAEGSEKRLYGAMLDVRAGLVEKASLTLARAVTIAVRYSAVRRQGFAPLGPMEQAARAAGGGGAGAASSSSSIRKKSVRFELQVLDYPTQQHALMPMVAWCYALQATGRHMRQLYNEYLKALDLRLLPEVHALSSGLKALTAEVVSAGVEKCRKLCGGHGYLKQSGLPDLFANYVAVATFEGTQQILEPQAARFILKVAEDAQQGNNQAPQGFALSADFDYVRRGDVAEALSRRCPATAAADLLEPAVQLEAFESRALALLVEASTAVQEEMAADADADPASLQQALVRQGVLLGRLARAHCQLVILRRFHESVARQEARLRGHPGADAHQHHEDGDVVVGQAEVRVLRQLVHLYALSVMEAEMAEFRAQDYFSAAQAVMCSREVLRLCRLVRAEAVCLMDAFQLSDALLGSTLGRADGRVYSAIFDEILKSPLNDSDVPDAYLKYWRRLLTASAGAGLGGNGSRL